MSVLKVLHIYKLEEKEEEHYEGKDQFKEREELCAIVVQLFWATFYSAA